MKKKTHPDIIEVTDSSTVSVRPIISAIPKITTLTQEFSNGDLNALRDKINELIANQ